MVNRQNKDAYAKIKNKNRSKLTSNQLDVSIHVQ